MLSSIQLTDEELRLRPFRLEDASRLHCAVRESLSELKPWMSWATDEYSERTARDYITIARARWEEHTFYAFVVLRGDELLGACTLSSIHSLYRFCNLGYWVRTSCHGQGIAWRAAKLAARFAYVLVYLFTDIKVRAFQLAFPSRLEWAFRSVFRRAWVFA